MKKVFLILISMLSVCLLSFASFQTGLTSYAFESTIVDENDILETYTYTDSTISEYYGSSANAISDVVGAEISYTPTYEFSFTATENVYFNILTYGVTTGSYDVFSDVVFTIKNDDLFSSIPSNMHVRFTQTSSVGSPFYFHSKYKDLGNGYYISQLVLFSGHSYKITISGKPFYSSGSTLVIDAKIDDPNNLIDMLSSTDLNILTPEDFVSINSNKYFTAEVTVIGNPSYVDFFSFHSFSYCFKYSSLLNGDYRSLVNNFFIPMFSNTFNGDLSIAFQNFYEHNYSIGNGWLYNVSSDLVLNVGSTTYNGNFCCFLNAEKLDTITNVSFDYFIDIVNFEFLIDMPTYRSQNSLILYNFDYSSLSYANRITYRLLRDKCFYDVVFEGDIPNVKTIMIDNPNLLNKTFSNYIKLNIDFDSIPVPLSGVINCGFDFNFGNFIEPFPQITANNSKQTFDRPPLPTDLTPRLNFEKTETAPWFRISLYFPVIKYIEYAFLWLLFYAPVVGDCTAFLYTFFNKFLAIFNIVLDLPMGTFVLSFIAFILCFKLFASFLPFASDKVSVTFKNISNNISNKRKENKNFEEKIKKQKLKKIDNFKKKKRVNKKQFNDDNPNRI